MFVRRGAPGAIRIPTDEPGHAVRSGRAVPLVLSARVAHPAAIPIALLEVGMMKPTPGVAQVALRTVLRNVAVLGVQEIAPNRAAISTVGDAIPPRRRDAIDEPINYTNRQGGRLVIEPRADKTDIAKVGATIPLRRGFGLVRCLCHRQVPFLPRVDHCKSRKAPATNTLLNSDDLIIPCQVHQERTIRSPST